MENRIPRLIPDIGSINPSDWVGGEWRQDKSCWHLVEDVYKSVGLIVPPIVVNASSAIDTMRQLANATTYTGWIEDSDKLYGGVVTMASGKHPFHVGIWLGGSILHSLQGCGVIVSENRHLAASGLRIVKHWRLHEHHHNREQPI